MPRKYSGPLRPGERSAKVPRRYVKKSVVAAPNTMRDTKKLIKSIVLKTAETKYRNFSLPKVELYHNNIYPMTDLMGIMPPQGDTDGDRNGDCIYATGIKIRLMLGQKADRPNVTYKIFVVQYDDDTSGTLTYSNFYHNASGNGLLDAVQTKRFKVRKALTIKSKGTSMEVGESGKEFIRPLSFWIPLKKKVKFQKDDAILVTNMPQQFKIIVLAYDAYGTLGTDNIAYIQGCATLYFKDP